MNTVLLHTKLVSFQSFGQGDAVVFLHGFLENKSMWDIFIPELCKTHQIITVDLLGHGATDVGSEVQTMEEQATLVIHLLTHLDIKKATFIGHSMGGYVALAIADLFPEKTKGILLINSTTLADSEERKNNRDRAIEAFLANKKTTVSVSIANLFSEKNRERMQKEVKKAQKIAEQTPIEGIIASLKGMKLRKDRTFVLENKRIKKGMVLGKNDVVLPYIDQLNVAETTKTKLTILEGGHMSHLENTTELFEILVNFLKND